MPCLDFPGITKKQEYHIENRPGHLDSLVGCVLAPRGAFPGSDEVEEVILAQSNVLCSLRMCVLTILEA